MSSIFYKPSALNIGTLVGDPDAPVNGDVWYNSATNQLMGRVNGVNVVIAPLPAPPPAPGQLRGLFPPITTPIDATTANATMSTIPIPPNTLLNNGDYFKVNVTGRINSSNTSKGMGVTLPGILGDIVNELGAPIIGTISAGANGRAMGFRIWGEVVRTGPNAASATFSLILGKSSFDQSGANQATGSGSIIVSRQVGPSTGVFGSGDWTNNTFNVVIKAYVAEDAGITQTIAIVEVCNF